MGNILDLLFRNLTGLTDNLVSLGLTVFAVALGFFAMRHLSRRRRTLDQQRMAALIKGLHYAGVSREVFARPSQDAHDHLLRGLRWLLGGAGLSGALYGYATLQPTAGPLDELRGLLSGIIPGAIGLAHLVFSWICSRRSRLQASASMAPRGYYRTVARRY